MQADMNETALTTTVLNDRSFHAILPPCVLEDDEDESKQLSITHNRKKQTGR